MTTSLAPVRLFVVDDHLMVHQGMQSVLASSQAVELVGGATNAHHALDRLELAAPQVALVDVTLPDGDGVSLVRRIREKHPDVHCLMFTFHGDQKALLAAVLGGACGYLIKQIDSAGIVDSVIQASQHLLRLDPAEVSALVARCRAAAAGPKSPRQSGPQLSPRELAIFDGAVAGLTDTEIGAQLQISAETVNRYVSLIFTKFTLSRVV